MNSNKNTIWIVIVLILIAGIAFFAFGKPDTTPLGVTPAPEGNSSGNIPDNTPSTSHTSDGNQNNPPVAEKMITVTSPKAGNSVDATNGFTVTGQAVGNWYFEATAPVIVYGKSGNVLERSYITAQGEWMTTDFVPFKGTIQPFLTKGETEGYIEFQNSNPSDTEGFRRSLRVNVTFPVQQTQTVKVYFNNSKMNPNTADCSKVYAVERTVPKASGIATVTLRELLKGPTNDEIEHNYVTAFDQGSGDELKSLNIKNGVATADFSILPSAGSCLVTTARAQIVQTLKQFSTIKSVKILLNGSESAALQP
jgi:hypothetical protein